VLVNFPLLVIPFAIYNIFAFLIPVDWKAPLGNGFQLMSGGVWQVTLSDLLILFTLFLLFFELLKATRSVTRTIIDHGLALILLLVALVEFIMVPSAATSTFAILLMIFLLDMIAGYAISLRVAQKDVSVEKGAGDII
jgi:hypothetical protein